MDMTIFEQYFLCRREGICPCAQWHLANMLIEPQATNHIEAGSSPQHALSCEFAD